MRKVCLMLTFALWGALLLPKPARSLEDCKEVKCKHMKAWMTKDNQLPGTSGTYGLRKPKDGDPTMHDPVEHAPPVNSAYGGRLIADEASPGDRTYQGVEYNRYEYTKVPDKVCKVANDEDGDSVFPVSFAKQEDWDEWKLMTPGPLWQQPHHLCQLKPGGGGDGPGK